MDYYMVDIKKKFKDFTKKMEMIEKIGTNKAMFHFLFGIKQEVNKFKININTKCLVLTHYPGAETKGLGGLIAQFPKNFEVLCFTNGSSMLKGLNPIDSASEKKQEFQDVMKSCRTKGYKLFDIDDKTLKNHYATFKKIDISEVDYIFIPNLYDISQDTLALLSHFKELLKCKEHKENLKIIMFSTDYTLPTFDLYVDISGIIETKKRMLNIYYPEDKYPKYSQKIIGLNEFNSLNLNCDYCETFLSFSIEDFLNITLI